MQINAQKRRSSEHCSLAQWVRPAQGLGPQPRSECLFGSWLHCFSSSSCLPGSKLMAQGLEFLSPTWEIRMEFLPSGFRLDLPQPSLLGINPAERRLMSVCPFCHSAFQKGGLEKGVQGGTQFEEHTVFVLDVGEVRLNSLPKAAELVIIRKAKLPPLLFL